MNYAINRVYESMKSELDEFGIEVNSDTNAIIYRGRAKILPPYSTSRTIKRELNQLLKQAQDAKKWLEDSKQARLL